MSTATTAPKSTYIPLYLLIYRLSPFQRAHFALWTPSAPTTNINANLESSRDISTSNPGTKIHVVGAPMTGFVLSFVRNYVPSADPQGPETVRIGEVEGRLVVDEMRGYEREVAKEGDSGQRDVGRAEEGETEEHQGDGIRAVTEELGVNAVPRAELERLATTIPVPRVSGNFLAAVDDKTNRRCQEWTMDFLRKLVELGYVHDEAVRIVQGRRDPPGFGIGLRARGGTGEK